MLSGAFVFGQMTSGCCSSGWQDLILRIIKEADGGICFKLQVNSFFEKKIQIKIMSIQYQTKKGSMRLIFSVICPNK